MALVTQIRAFPTLEPVREAIIRAVNESFGDALTLVEERMEQAGFAAVDLEVPAVIQRAVISSLDLTPDWPCLVVSTWYARVMEANEQLGANRWSGIVTMDYIVQNSDAEALTISLDRYAAALWCVIIDADERNALDGAQVLYGTEEMEASRPSAETPNSRVVRLQFQVTFRT